MRFCRQVRPHVEADLMRVWSDTAATKEHKKRDEKYINIQQPLYDTPGTSATSVRRRVFKAVLVACLQRRLSFFLRFYTEPGFG